ncbi:MAG: HAD family hydrolase [Pseudomonadota bacterium]
MRQRVTTVAFDADDTLWDNERFFQLTQARFAELLSDHTNRETLMDRLLAAERRNLGHYGFGIKGFTLSMIETALEVTDNRVSGSVIAELLDAGREMLRQPVDLLPHARDAVEAARETHRIVLITKGDLLDQERKLAQSGLGDLFDAVEIVSNKTTDVYHDIFRRHDTGAENGLMVGNSMKSDVLPMIEAGGWGVFVPHGYEWALEQADAPNETDRYARIEHLGYLRALLERLG